MSFWPQLHLIRARQDTEGISLTYVLINLIVATQQLGLYIHMISFQYKGAPAGMINDPPSFGDYLNLTQFAAVWLGHFTLYAVSSITSITASYLPNSFLYLLYLLPQTAWSTAAAALIYLGHLTLHIPPLIIEAILPAEGPDTDAFNDRTWAAAWYWAGHTLYLNHLISCLGFLSLFAQAYASVSRPALGALSVEGLRCQAVVFTAVADDDTVQDSDLEAFLALFQDVV
ncbi:uncharacterized protein LTR77_003908 [Saxophila tyrrhenica]|uniref:Uncharacterized protein n=1 Tax=Saxophila tyrrhenica TaxID=1690608 RepID=A0AAV9PFN8_9PEZI|nr:hypothetical protein LTR77_003908 [Saxophila tyrrhenica]